MFGDDLCYRCCNIAINGNYYWCFECMKDTVRTKSFATCFLDDVYALDSAADQTFSKALIEFDIEKLFPSGYDLAKMLGLPAINIYRYDAISKVSIESNKAIFLSPNTNNYKRVFRVFMKSFKRK